MTDAEGTRAADSASMMLTVPTVHATLARFAYQSPACFCRPS